MSKFASGKYAYAVSDRSGLRYRYKDMRREWNGLLVGKDEFEVKHPQLGPFRSVSDAQALKDARPEQDLDNQRSIQHGFNPVGFPTKDYLPASTLEAVTSVGDVTVVIGS
tara:strand:+ start:138 stop:467 length:330 start_codon:yes stop_codon:yes gene_type:complete